MMEDIDILYKSDMFIAVDKYPDIRINSDDPEIKVTVEHQLRRLFPDLVDRAVAHGFRFSHRLDHATSGALCVALTKKAAAQINDCFSKGLVTKHYLGLLRGHMAPTSESGVLIKEAIGTDSSVKDFCKMCTPSNPACVSPREASTTIHVLQHGTYDGDPATKVLLIPHTGRTHQLRVHCDHIGHLIVGDFTYSGRQDTKPPRMMLHAHRLVIPAARERVDVTAPDPFVTERYPLWVVTHTYKQYSNIVAGTEGDLQRDSMTLSSHNR